MQAYLDRKMISCGLENPMQHAWPEGCTLPFKLLTNSSSHSSVVVVIMVRQEYLVEYQRCKISLRSFAPVTTSGFLFLPFPLVLHSCTCAFSDPAQGLFWNYIPCRLCFVQLILCYPVPRVCFFRRCFMELLPLDQFQAFLGKSS